MESVARCAACPRLIGNEYRPKDLYEMEIKEG
jgi:hypothetical protein